MGYYAIGIGGTGAKCLESLVHLAAAGMIPDERLYVLFVDPDTTNGCLERAVVTLNHYKAFKDDPQLTQSHLLRTKIFSADSNIWTPFTDNFTDNAQPRLSDFFDYHSLRMAGDKTRVAAAHLFESLYSEKERETTLNRGFRGHPSIGASVMAQTVRLGEEDPWRTFRSRVSNDTDAKIFLAGSIFGGTGASGFPTIAQLIRDELGGKNVKMGGALVLPYFTFAAVEDDELKAKAEHFLMNTQAALKYYHLWNKTAIYDAIYLLGDESQIEVEHFLGGSRQRNSPHFIELYAALAAVDFFGRDFEDDQEPQYFMIARERTNQIEWTDLPDGENGETIRSKIRQLTCFAFAYLSVYQPRLQEIHNNGKGYRAPWYVDFFERSGISNDQTLLDIVANYCRDFLLWLANIQHSVGPETGGLVKYEAYAKKVKGNRLELRDVNDFVLEEFGNLISPGEQPTFRVVNKLWEHMCDDKGKNDSATGIGKFLSTLYQNCAKV